MNDRPANGRGEKIADNRVEKNGEKNGEKPSDTTGENAFDNNEELRIRRDVEKPPLDSDSLRDFAQEEGRRLAEDLSPWTVPHAWRDGGEAPRDAVFRILDESMRRLSQSHCWGEQNRIASGCLWRESERILRGGSLQLHARDKPHGYAGDFEMLDRICRWDCRGEGLSGAFDDYFQSQAAPQAVRNRTQIVAEAIEGECAAGAGPVNIVSIGAGPAADVERALDALSPEEAAALRVTLLDLDPRALEFARRRLGRAGRVDAQRENLFRLARRDPAAQYAPAQLVVCTGLFDYLGPQDAGALLQWCWRSLAPQGRLMVFNFAPENPSRAYMEWIGNWYLRYRTRDQMRELAESAGLDDFLIGAEAQGIDLFVDARRQD